MRRALRLARRGWGQTAPNPLVGAVVVRAGEVVGTGWHARLGEAHAEAVALREAGVGARGAEVYVTLEPCAHHGRTPPCADALIAAGVRRVVIAHADPNPTAAGGAARLRAAGIEVVMGVLRDAAAELNAPFFFQHQRSDRPFVTLKLALSREGAIASADRTPHWLTGEASRRAVHRMRAQADAVAVGIGTALADDPALTVRYGKRPRLAPRRVVFDRTARLPLASRLVKSSRKVPVEVLATTPPPERVAALEAAGVAVHRQSDLASHLQGLRSRGIGHLFVEGGAGLAESLLTSGFVDRLVIFQTPVRLGAGALPGFGTAVPPDEESGRWKVVERKHFGEDLMTVYRPAAR